MAEDVQDKIADVLRKILQVLAISGHDVIHALKHGTRRKLLEKQNKGKNNEQD